ncbi:TPA: multidrug efflux MATE transporter MepA [Staphylococcus argenteus]|uniref:multidrug efflux MATE transporter MepA n=1 Tax=Staphylococcus argenteus TaxID=985002 RepID=UPI000233FFCE|nr:multidrug efflux MATE transporter MepA [Staphylococcus argenteus]MBE2132380.1 multidrug efflux MATE transporter MepA [Staphylococcus argenteus]PNY95152.1 multidrug efflux MATE transporter MepA [Staphylococcus argenteus]CCE58161.1 Multidrug export protein mepA [Staphylococcus argenteus]SUJ03256.1 Multi antimicrobial extrusion protein (Na(+)/drug antiporter), MATE family of MDR efflux pumps [Staphylococcus argenteus]HDY9430393.1 multidrug efflux MATE transporter MepA [Staphylococcus argenteus
MKDEQLYYFEKSPVFKAMMHFSLPMMIGTLLSVVYGILNIYFIGFIGDSHMISAISLTLPIFAILMGLGNLFGIGGGTYISRLLGAKDYSKSKFVSSFSIYGGIVLGIIVILATIPFSDQIAMILGAKGETLALTSNYLKVMFLSAPFVILFFILEQFARAIGAPIISMIGMLASVGLNIILDPILIFGFDLNVVGAALGTAISNVAAAIFFIVYFMKNSDVVSVNFKFAKPNKEMLSEIFKIGVPAFLMSILMGFTGLVLNLFLAHYGNFAIASYGISFRLVQFPELIIMGLCEGVVPLIAYNFMANKGRMKDVIKVVIMSIGVIFAVCMIAVFTIGHHMVGLFTTDQQIVEMATFILKVTMTSLLLNGIGFLFTGMLQATGQGRGATIMAILQGAIIIPVLFIMNGLFGLTGVIWSLLIAESLCAFAAMLIVYLLRNRLTVDTSELIEG